MEPLVADPVAFAIDERGRVFVAESERQERGVEDNRHQPYWLLDDLSNHTTADRLRMFEKWTGKFEGGMSHFSRWADRVRVLVDPDEHGRPTRTVDFSGDLREPLDGTNAGVLVRDGDVWVTCIPTLWRFRDTNDDGVADERTRVMDGFGVRIALRGHDMHGLVFGPDGRLYWSIGDRGYHLELPDGRVLADPKSGAVFRCEPDGSNLEIFCTGLRNPQELAFNRYGDLFTGDNNSDAGDKARIVWCVDGGETGWDMNFQTLEGANQRGPWNQERIWRLWTESDATDPLRAAWTLPPLAHVSSGPSGLVQYPGVGFDARYADAMFLCDFLGDRKSSRVLAFSLERDGAGYAVKDVHSFVSDVLPTDVDFDYAGRMMISDWDAGWESNGKGQLYRVWDPRLVDAPEVREVTSIMAQGFLTLKVDACADLLSNADMRVRLRAQWELASRGGEGWVALLGACANTHDLLTRLHGIWGLGQALRTHGAVAGANEPTGAERTQRVAEIGAALVEALADEDPEIRTQLARVLGEAKWMPALESLITLASDEDLRVRMSAATALGRLGSKEAIPALVAMLWENEDLNPFVRHAASLALARIGDREKLLELASDQFPQVRLGAVLALRRLADPALARSLFDPERRIATEAARAIHDLPIEGARPALLALAERWATASGGDSAAASGAAIGRPVIRRDLWRPIQQAASIDLVNHPVFERTPTSTRELEDFSAPTEDGNLFVARISGLFVPSQSGPHLFAIASDDASALFVGRSEDPSSRQLVARVTAYVQPGQYDAQPGQQSVPIQLVAGKMYWIEARHAQGGGANHCSVRVTRPDGTVEEPIGRRPQPNLDAVPLLRRLIDECLRDGSARSADALLGIASQPEVPLIMRTEALEALRLFADPRAKRPSIADGTMLPTDPPIMRDRVNGHVRPAPLAGRDLDGYRRALATRLPEIASTAPPELRALARTLADEQGVALDPAAALATLRDGSAAPRERAQCLLQLVRIAHPEAASLVAAALDSDAPELRIAAREALVRGAAPEATAALRRALAAGTRAERQLALAQLARLGRADADAVLIEALQSAIASRGGGTPSSTPFAWSPELDLDLMEAAESRRPHSTEVAAELASWRAGAPAAGAALMLDLALVGGDSERGRELVNFHSASACLRCHALDGHGGTAAPALDRAGTRLARIDLLRALVEPNAAIAEGYTAPSAMPDMTTLLSPREVRDIVEYLQSLRD